MALIERLEQALDNQDWKTVNQILDELDKAYKFDVSDKEACQKAVEEILSDFGSVDVLVNNAGITRDGLFMRMNSENWEAVINTNLNSAFYMTSPIIKTIPPTIIAPTAPILTEPPSIFNNC